MEYAALLTVHIGGAIATGIAAAYAAFAMLSKRSGSYQLVAIMLGLFAALEVTTGTALAVASAKITVVSICGNIVVYLAIVSILEALLFMRLKAVSLPFPSLQTFSPVGVSIALLLSALAFGL